MLSKEQYEKAFENDPSRFHLLERKLNKEEVNKVIDKFAADVRQGKTLSENFLKTTYIDSDDAKAIAKNIDYIRKTLWRDYLCDARRFVLYYFNERDRPGMFEQISKENQVYFNLILYMNKWMENLMSNPMVKGDVMLKKFGKYATEGK